MLAQKELRKNSVLYLVGGSILGENAADFISQLRDPILIDAETEVALSSAVIDFPDGAAVQIGANSNVGVMLKTGQATYVATLRAGEYVPSELAEQLQLALNNTGPNNPLLSNEAGGFRVGLAINTSVSYVVRYKSSMRSAPVVANTVCDGGSSYAGGTFTNTAGGTELWCVVNTPIATQVAQCLLSVAVNTDFSIALMKTGAAHDVQNELFKVTYSSTAEEFTPYVRGVAGTPIALGAALPKSTLLLAKLGNDIYFGHRPDVAAQQTAFTDILRVGLLDADTELVEPNLFLAVGSSTAGGNLTGIVTTRSGFSTNAVLEIAGEQVTFDGAQLAETNPEIHAHLYGGSPVEVAAFPPGTANNRSVTLDFAVPGTCAATFGFNDTDVLRRAANNTQWDSTTTPTASIDSSGLQTSLYVTSTALNVGSRFASKGAGQTSPFILGSLPFASSIGVRSYAEFVEPNPFFQSLAVGSKQLLTSIDIQLRDSRQTITELPNTTTSQSRSTLKILVRNHPTA